MQVNSVINTSTRQLLKYCGLRGFNCEGFWQEVEIPNARIDSNVMWDIWERVYKSVKDDRIAFYTAQALPIGAYGVLDYLMLSSEKLGDVIEAIPRYYSLINSSASIAVERHNGSLTLELINPSDTPGEHLKRSAEYTFAALIQRFQLATQRRIQPSRISFQHFLSPPDNALWGTELNFGQKSNRLVFEEDLIDIRLPLADPALAETLNFHATQLLDRLEPNGGLVELVKKIVAENMTKGTIGIDKTAKELAMSKRSLQRSLYAHGTSYQAILDQFRAELAITFLRQHCELNEISYRLGFSEPSTLSRTFKKWTGKTISQWKAAQHVGESAI